MRYAYCLNNPLKYTDPSGEWWTWLVGGIIGGVANVISNWDDIDGDFVKFNQYAFVGCVAGSTSVWLAEQEVGLPAIGMVSGWIIGTGNAYIQGARGGDVMEAGAQGALWGGVSGFAMMGLAPLINEFFNIPWTTDYSGSPSNGYEVSLGEAISRFTGRSVSDYIAQQGMANAEVILTSYQLGYLIDVYRFAESYNTTISTFTASGPGSQSVTGYFLEPAGPSTTISGLDRRIPAGTYNISPYSSRKFNNVYIISNEQVPESRRILIHSGNYGDDTSGCLLPGSSYYNVGSKGILKSNYAVRRSRYKLNQLRQLLGSHQATLIIHDIPPIYNYTIGL